MWSNLKLSGTWRKYGAGIILKNHGTTFSIDRVCCWVNSWIMAVCVTRWMSILCAACHERKSVEELVGWAEWDRLGLWLCGSSMLERACVFVCWRRRLDAAFWRELLPASDDNRMIILFGVMLDGERVSRLLASPPSSVAIYECSLCSFDTVNTEALAQLFLFDFCVEICDWLRVSTNCDIIVSRRKPSLAYHNMLCADLTVNDVTGRSLCNLQSEHSGDLEKLKVGVTHARIWRAKRARQNLLSSHRSVKPLVSIAVWWLGNKRRE